MTKLQETSVFSALEVSDPRYLSREAAKAIASRGCGLAEGGGKTSFYMKSWWQGTAHWARNRVAVSADSRSNTIDVTRLVRNTRGAATTDQIDDASIERVMRTAERIASIYEPGVADRLPKHLPSFRYASPAIWSDTTANQTAEQRDQVVRKITDVAESQGLLSAGTVQATVGGVAFNSDDQTDLYSPITRAECSLTVRDPKANASGWAGLSSFDWARIDADKLAARAVEKCIQSRNPVAVEPGRWNVIFEPQAVYDLIGPFVERTFGRDYAEWADSSPFHIPRTENSKLGQRVAGERITITHDITDPDLGVVPFSEIGEPYTSVKLIENGILTGLAYNRWYALEQLRQNDGYQFSGAFRLHGGTATMDEMVQSTARGLLVTRLSEVAFEPVTGIATGTTRDGVWLIERGKISKPVKNFRFFESPLFFLNNVEQLGVAVPVYTKKVPAIVPPVKARDFNMAALVDAF